jgi:hypothetical protein
MKRASVGGDEFDAFSHYWRHWTYWKPGQLRRIKRGANKRERRDAKLATRNHDHPSKDATS